MTAAAQWRHQLGQWGIPEEILGQAPESPWWFPPAMFAATTKKSVIAQSSIRAREALPDGGSVLDVGCGGGAATYALVPPAGRVFGVDRQDDMIELYVGHGRELGVEADGLVGDWLAVHEEAPTVDVVVCHNVFYNVPDLGPFAQALAEHANRRVVVELTDRHPIDRQRLLWQHFWGHDLPVGPTAADAAQVLSEVGIDAQSERFVSERTTAASEDDVVVQMRRRLCLSSDRDDEVRAFVKELPPMSDRVALWWDVR